MPNKLTVNELQGNSFRPFDQNFFKAIGQDGALIRTTLAPSLLLIALLLLLPPRKLTSLPGWPGGSRKD